MKLTVQSIDLELSKRWFLIVVGLLLLDIYALIQAPNMGYTGISLMILFILLLAANISFPIFLWRYRYLLTLGFKHLVRGFRELSASAEGIVIERTQKVEIIPWSRVKQVFKVWDRFSGELDEHMLRLVIAKGVTIYIADEENWEAFKQVDTWSGGVLGPIAELEVWINDEKQ